MEKGWGTTRKEDGKKKGGILFRDRSKSRQQGMKKDERLNDLIIRTKRTRKEKIRGGSKVWGGLESFLL